MRLGPWELGVILVIVLILFGAGKLPDVFSQFGRAVKNFKDAQKDDSIDVGGEKSSPQIGESFEEAKVAEKAAEKRAS